MLLVHFTQCTHSFGKWDADMLNLIIFIYIGTFGTKLNFSVFKFLLLLCICVYLTPTVKFYTSLSPDSPFSKLSFDINHILHWFKYICLHVSHKNKFILLVLHALVAVCTLVCLCA